MGYFRKPIRVRVCSRRGGVKTIEEYYGNDHYCKICRLRYNSDWTQKHPDRRYLINWKYRNKITKLACG